MNANELKDAFRSLPAMPKMSPAHTWEFWRYDLRQNVMNNDPEKFLTWPGLVGTMFVGNAPYIDYEAECLGDALVEVIAEPGFGSPALYDVPFVWSADFKSSGNLIHQAYHIQQWEEHRTSKEIQDCDIIVEIGGGYGAMALLVHRLGFKGRYIIYDLPEFSLLQQYYLSNVGVTGVEFITQFPNEIDCDLLIGLFSLGEMPLETRSMILAQCHAKSFLMAYSARWGGYDNIGWGNELMKRKGYLWNQWNIGHLPNCWYLVGDERK